MKNNSSNHHICHKHLWYLWILFLCSCIGLGIVLYYRQLELGLQVTGLSRDVSWGFYIGQSTYLVGVAASAIVLIIPSYFHHWSEYKVLLPLAECMATASVIMCLLFIAVDLGQPQRIFNLLLYPSPTSPMFWDMLALSGYLVLSFIIATTTLGVESYGASPPKWLSYLVYISVFWAFSLHTVTALLYAGLPGRAYWLTAILAARFLASAFCSGPAILLLICLTLQRLGIGSIEKKTVQGLSVIIAYAVGVHLFFFMLELFTAFYSQTPDQVHTFAMVFGTDPLSQGLWLPWWMRASALMGIIAFLLLAFPVTRRNARLLPIALFFTVIAMWIDKGLVLIAGGLMQNPFGSITPYTPSPSEFGLSLGIYAVGALITSLLWRYALRVQR